MGPRIERIWESGESGPDSQIHQIPRFWESGKESGRNEKTAFFFERMGGRAMAQVRIGPKGFRARGGSAGPKGIPARHVAGSCPSHPFFQKESRPGLPLPGTPWAMALPPFFQKESGFSFLPDPLPDSQNLGIWNSVEFGNLGIWESGPDSPDSQIPKFFRFWDPANFPKTIK